jgi:alpha-N-arabinofuranosidase
MCSYAPLLAHVDGWQWTPDLIWFNNLISFGTTNYYVQKLFSMNKGTNVLNMLLDNKPLTGQKGLYATAAIDKQTNEIILKLVNTTDKTQNNSIALQTSKKILPKARMTVLKNATLDGLNTIDKPDIIKPVDQDIALKGKNLNYQLTLTLLPYYVSKCNKNLHRELSNHMAQLFIIVICFGSVETMAKIRR